jgi:ABC-type glycerol-3-phosphate transport system substrate-binding protein
MRLWHGLTGSDGAVFAEMLQQFAEANPEACFESQGIPWDLFFQKYPTAVAAGTPPDMVIFHAAEVQQMAAEGLMQPMDDWFEGTGLGKDQFNEVLINQITVDGQTMAVPFDNHGWLLWTNTKVIEDAGLDPANLPKNGAEFIEWAQKVTKDVNGKHPNEEGFDKDNIAVYATYWTWPRYTVPTTLWQFGGAVVSPDNKTATLNSPESIAAIQYIQDLMCKYYVMNPYQPGTPYGGEPYENEQIALWWEGTWTGGYMRDRPDVAAVTVPNFINSYAPDGNQAVKFDSHIFSIPTGVDDKGKAEAYAMAKYLVENGAYWATSGQVPALKSVQALPEVQSIASVAKAAEQFNAIGRTDTAHKSFIEIQTAWETAVGNALATCDADVTQALNDGNVAIQAILDRP